MELLPIIPRAENGYRIFNEKHVAQLKLLKIAFRSEIIGSNLRNMAISIVKTAAKDHLEEAYQLSLEYQKQLETERQNAEEAIQIALNILENASPKEDSINIIGRRDIARQLNITTEVLRNWERNGLIQVPRNASGRRQYSHKEMERLKIIRTLRNAHYSMMSILRMLNQLDKGRTDLKYIIDTPEEGEDIIYVTDQYITALCKAEADVIELIQMLKQMKANEEIIESIESIESKETNDPLSQTIN